MTEQKQREGCSVPCAGCGGDITTADNVLPAGESVLCLACLANRPETDFAERLRSCRVARGLTLKELDRQAGVIAGASRWYESETTPIPWATLKSLIRVLGAELVTLGMVDVRERLRAVAVRVRIALERRQVLEYFPRESCQAASRMLARYLVEVEGVSPITGVANGERTISDDAGDPYEQSHFWIECGGYIIDITANQFSEVREPVIVTADRSWHDQFAGQTRLDQNELRRMNDYLSDLYKALLKQMGVCGGD